MNRRIRDLAQAYAQACNQEALELLGVRPGLSLIHI